MHTQTTYEFLQLSDRRFVASGMTSVRDRMGGAVIVSTHSAPESPTAHVLWAHGPAVDWSVVAQWSARAANQDSGAARVLVLPYLPGDYAAPEEAGVSASVNAALAARTGITDLVTLDPAESLWCETLEDESRRLYGSPVGVHLLPLADIIEYNVEPAGGLTGVIAPGDADHRRALAAARALGVPRIAAHRASPFDAVSLDLPDPHGSYLVVGGSCGRGTEYAQLAKAAPHASLELWVTHGAFYPEVAGEELSEYNWLHTTDSLPTASGFCTDFPGAAYSLRPWVRAAVRAIADERDT